MKTQVHKTKDGRFIGVMKEKVTETGHKVLYITKFCKSEAEVLAQTHIADIVHEDIFKKLTEAKATKTVPTEMITDEMREAGVDETTPLVTREEAVAELGEEEVVKPEEEALAKLGGEEEAKKEPVKAKKVAKAK